MTGLALALAAGAALPSIGVPLLPVALLLLLASWRPIQTGRRPAVLSRLRWVPVAALAGLAHGAAHARGVAADCRWRRPPGPLEVVGWVGEVETPTRVRLEVFPSEREACSGPIRVQGRLPRGTREGMVMRVRGRWVPRADALPGLDPIRAGVLFAADLQTESPEVRGLAGRWASLRAAGVERVQRRFGREGALVSALVFARRDRLDPDLRDAFATTGTAHLLAISGFHVGVLVGLIIWTLGRLVPPRRAFAVGTLAAWTYVAVLGFPDAATRAAVLLSLVTLGRLIGRPVSGAGALGTALLLLVLIDPGVAGRIGAQLSFAGALGLAVWARPWGRALVSLWSRHVQPRPGRRVRGLLDALAATAAATLATLPFVAWHFERVSLVAIPASIGATPLVALALPSILAAMILDALPLPGAAVAAAGAEGLLGATRLWVGAWAALPGATLAVARPEVLTALVGAAGGWLLVRTQLGVGRPVRALVVAAGVAVAGLTWPISRHVLRNGSLEVHMLDVGQGDALALRTPAGRWVVIDAGPPPGEWLTDDLRRLGARTVDLLLLSHPDADHVGGAGAVLAGLKVRGVAGPGTVRGSGPWQDAVRKAREAGVPWRVLARGDDFDLDGVTFRLLHPVPGPRAEDDPNAASLVVEVAWRGVRFLFMGDAPAEVERAIVAGPRGVVTEPRTIVAEPRAVDVLKVGHHGSLTSSDPIFLNAILPSVALVSAGRGNRYGHPEPEVLRRLADVGAEVWRTDVSGPVVVRVSRAGHVSVEDRR